MKKVELTDEEIVFLDNKCREEIQLIIDLSKKRIAMSEKYSDISVEQARFVADIVDEAERKKKLNFQHVELNYCKKCGSSKSYTKFESGPRKGKDNYDKPIRLDGIDLEDSCVKMEHSTSLGCCLDCWKMIKEAVKEELKEVIAELPKELRVNNKQYKRYKRKKCLECGWEGHEGEMGNFPKCPKCNAQNPLFGKTKIKIIDGYEIVRIENSEVNYPIG